MSMAPAGLDDGVFFNMSHPSVQKLISRFSRACGRRIGKVSDRIEGEDRASEPPIGQGVQIAGAGSGGSHGVTGGSDTIIGPAMRHRGFYADHRTALRLHSLRAQLTEIEGRRLSARQEYGDGAIDLHDRARTHVERGSLRRREMAVEVFEHEFSVGEPEKF